MIKDAHLILSEGQLMTTFTGASTNVIDLTKLGDAVAGAELYLVVRVGTAGDTAEEDGTLNIAIQTDSAEAFDTAVVNLAEKDLTEAELTANTIVWKIKLPPGCKKYLRLYYTEGEHAFTGGTIDAFLTPDVNIA
jgi:hypothetical protein